MIAILRHQFADIELDWLLNELNELSGDSLPSRLQDFLRVKLFALFCDVKGVRLPDEVIISSVAKTKMIANTAVRHVEDSTMPQSIGLLNGLEVDAVFDGREISGGAVQGKFWELLSEISADEKLSDAIKRVSDS